MRQETQEKTPEPLFVSQMATLHEVAGEVRAAFLRAYDVTLWTHEMALFERGIGAHRERAFEVLMSSAPNSPQFQYALCWLDTSLETSPVLQLCWASTRFVDLLALKKNPQTHPFDLVSGGKPPWALSQEHTEQEGEQP